MEHKLNIATSAGRRETGEVAGVCSIRITTSSTQPFLHRIGDCSIHLLFSPGKDLGPWRSEESEPIRNNNNPDFFRVFTSKFYCKPADKVALS